MKRVFFQIYSVSVDFFLQVGRCSLLFFFLAGGLHAQNDDKENFFLDGRKLELGANVTSVLFSTLGNSNRDLSPGRFPWTVKTVFATGDALRFGLGLNLRYEDQPQRRFQTFDNYVSFRMGYEWRIHIEKRWVALFAIDGMLDFSSEQVISNTQTDFAIIRLDSWGVGGGPVMGIQFAPLARIVLGTEASLYGLFRIVNRSEEFSNFPDQNIDLQAYQGEANLSVPRWIYLSIRL